MAKSKQEILQSINEMAAESYYNLQEYNLVLYNKPRPSDWEDKTFRYDCIDENDDIILNDNLSLDDKKECLTMLKAAGEFVGTWGWEQFFQPGEEDIHHQNVDIELRDLIHCHFDDIKSTIEDCSEAKDEEDMYWEYSDVILDAAERGDLNDCGWASDLLQAIEWRNMVDDIQWFAEKNGEHIWKRLEKTGEFYYDVAY